MISDRVTKFCFIVKGIKNKNSCDTKNIVKLVLDLGELDNGYDDNNNINGNDIERAHGLIYAIISQTSQKGGQFRS